MTNRTRDRDNGVFDHGGTRFGFRNRRDGTLNLPSNDDAYEANAEWLRVNELHLDGAALEDMTARLADGPVNAVTRLHAFEAAYIESNGYSFSDGAAAVESVKWLAEFGAEEHAASLRAVLEAKGVIPKAQQPESTWADSNGDGSLESPVGQYDARLQAGQVFDAVLSDDGSVYHRRRKWIVPERPTAMRIQTDRQLTEDEVDQLNSLIGYQFVSTLHGRGEWLDVVHRDSPYSFVINLPEDLGNCNFGPFENTLTDIVREGSLLRRTDQAGPGTAGTRAVPGFNDNAPAIEWFYDSVRAGVNLMDGDLFDEHGIRKMQATLDDLGYVS